LDRRSDVPDVLARRDLGDADPKALVRARDDLARERGGLRAHEVRDRRIAVVAVELRRHVDVHEVALAQDLLRRGDPVAHDVVDARADALREAAVSERRGDAAVLAGSLLSDLGQLERADPQAPRT